MYIAAFYKNIIKPCRFKSTGYLHEDSAVILRIDIPVYTMNLKVDKDVKMGIVTDVKQELRKAGAFKLNYATRRAGKKIRS